MIIYYLILGLQSVVSALGSFLPSAATLPTLGPVDLDTLFSAAVGYWRYFAGIFPPLQTAFDCAIIFLSYKLIMLAGRFIFGQRLPVERGQ